MSLNDYFEEKLSLGEDGLDLSGIDLGEDEPQAEPDLDALSADIGLPEDIALPEDTILPEDAAVPEDAVLPEADTAAAGMPGWLDQLLDFSQNSGSAGEPLPVPLVELDEPAPAIERVEGTETGPEEVTGEDWQSQFIILDEPETADEPEPADGAEADGETESPAELPEEDGTEAAFLREEAAEEEPAVPDEPDGEEPLPEEEKAEDEDDDFYLFPKKKRGKHEQEFSIEQDYRRDFGEYDRIHPVKVDRHHRTGCVGGLLYFLFILVSGALLGGILWLAAMDVLAIGKPAKDVQIVVPEGFTVEEVTDSLHEGGLIRYKALFKLFAKFAKADQKIDPGVYELKTSYDYRALVSCMQTSSGYRIETEVTVPEGYNLFQLFALLEEAEVCTQEKLWDAAANYAFEYDFLDESTLGERLRLEGYLFPDTYKFYVNDDPVRVINKFLRNFDSKFNEDYRARAEELGYSMRDILSVASMVEKETGVGSERATIASVIYNRLASEDYPYLQIDSTVYYAAAVMDKEFSTDIDCVYNTYLYEGLPGPITNPGEASIRAALYPETTNYYFYAATKDFTTRFFTRYSDFESFVQSDEFQRVE